MYQPDKIFPLPESLPAETVREPWRQALLDAAEYIRVHGWCQNKYQAEDGAVCAVGAIMWSHFGDEARPIRNDAINALDRFLVQTVADYCDIPDFNDAFARTKAEVIGALEGAARSALREGG